MVFHPVVSRSCPGRVRCSTRWRPPFRKICDCGAVGVLLVKKLVGLWWGGGVVPVGDSNVASDLKKLARTCLLSCHDVFAELVAVRASHCLLLLSVSHSPGKHYMVVSRWCPSGVRVAVVSRSCPGGVPVVSR